MKSLLHPREDAVGIELVEFIAVPYPRVNRLLRDRTAELFGADNEASGHAEMGVALGQFRLGVDVETRVVDYSASRLPIPSCNVTIECTPLRVGRYMRSMETAVTAYPVSRAVTVLWLEGTYRPTPGHSPDRLVARRIVRACVEDMFDRLVQTIRTEAGVAETEQRLPAAPTPPHARRRTEAELQTADRH